MYVLPPRGPTWAARSDFRTPWRFAQNVAKPVLWMKDERVRNVGTFAKPATEFSTFFFPNNPYAEGTIRIYLPESFAFFSLGSCTLISAGLGHLGPIFHDMCDCETEAHSPWHVPWDRNCRVRGRNCCFRLNWLVILFFWFYIPLNDLSLEPPRVSAMLLIAITLTVTLRGGAFVCAVQVASAVEFAEDFVDDLQSKGIHLWFCHHCLNAFKTRHEDRTWISGHSLCMDDVRPLTLSSHESWQPTQQKVWLRGSAVAEVAMRVVLVCRTGASVWNRVISILESSGETWWNMVKHGETLATNLPMTSNVMLSRCY